MPVKKSAVILSEKKKRRNPFIAFLLSTAVTGLGQVYNGSLSKGFTFLAVRTMLLLLVPFCALARESGSHVSTFAALIFTAFLASAVSPVEAAVFAAMRKEISLKRYNSAYFYGGYVLAALLVTALALSAVGTFFTIAETATGESLPSAAPGEYLLVMTYHPGPYTRGDLVFCGGTAGRIIAGPGSSVRMERNYFTVDDIPLTFGRFEKEDSPMISQKHLPYVQIERGNGRDYPVLADFSAVKAGVKEFKIPRDGYLISSDNRVPAPAVGIIAAGDITGRVEGILFSPNIRRLLMKPFIEPAARR